MKMISMTELFNHLGQLGKDEVILDVRTTEEYAEGHVPGSVNIPVADLESRVDELTPFKSVFIHCRSGGRAQTAGAILTQHGLKNLTCVAGSGFPDWERAGYPVEKG